MKLVSFLWVVAVSTCLEFSMAQTVTQSQRQISVQEAQTVTLECTYDTSDSYYYLFWYKQPSSREMIFIIQQESFNPQTAPQNRYSVNFQKAAKSINLMISDSQLEDAAMYFCAYNKKLCASSGTGNYGLIFGKGTKLSVTPNITHPDPAVYQLRSPKSSITSVCLFTDFKSSDNQPDISNSKVLSTDATVLTMKTMDSKSNGVLAWSDTKNFICNDTFKDMNFYSSSESLCDAKLVEESFETDMNLNFQNLFVIGLRILLLKVTGFNLLMTLRLWSR
ncbi:PREDICTED: uncharacterized protein LOC102818564 [Chrysochloris asiatica]|uniref:Uncharacterized protein LOC102818564 n=1 Tax=Chrysochloris asiatica TaxID=185453 RepID=A0A9B0WI01_CHRAS|nr:PREDICTED: uncharacterized protein LOC102818564 [Chrysochloris asiatica]